MSYAFIFSSRTVFCWIAGLVLAIAASLPGTREVALGQSVVATGQSFITSRLLPGKRTEDGGRLAGLRLSMEPGWKTYWRNPGETGIPPRFNWSASRNVREVKLHWPRPGMFKSFGMWTAGYSDVVLFPVEVSPEDPSLPMRLSMSAELGVCKDICVLELVEVSVEIAPDDPEIGARQIRSALRRVPTKASPDTIIVRACRFGGTGRDRQMSADLGLVAELSNPYVLVEHSQGAWIKGLQQRAVAGGLELDVDFVLPEGQTWIDRSAFRMTVLGDEAAYDIQGCRVG